MKYELWVYSYICDGDYGYVFIDAGSKKKMLEHAKAYGDAVVCKEGEDPQ